MRDEPKELIVSAERKALWAVELDLVAQLDRVCRKHGIRYFIDGGTALGAVRHGGFVPWDDDLDVIMTRADYKRLCAVASDFDAPYFLQTNETDPGSARGHAQLRNSATTAILRDEMFEGKPLFAFNQGVFLDIFPFDNIPDDAVELARFRRRLVKAWRKVKRIKAGRALLTCLSNGRIEQVVSRLFVPALATRFLEIVLRKDLLAEACRRLESLAETYDDRETKFVAPITLDPHHREVLPARFLSESVDLPFEFLTLPAMREHVRALEINYGNWKKHVVGGGLHGGVLIDLDRPYTDYLR